MKTVLLLISFFNLFSFSFAQAPSKDPRWELKFIDDFDSIYPSPFFIDSGKWNRYFPYTQNGLPLTCNCKTDPSTQKIKCDTLGKTYFTQWGELPGSNIKVDTAGTGTLKIIARKENFNAVVTNHLPCHSPKCDVPGRCVYNPRTKDSVCVNHDTILFNYTTAMLYSKQKFRYGYFELRFKIPAPPEPPATDSGFTIDWWMWNRDGLLSNEIDMFEIRAKDNLYTNNVHYKRDAAGTDQAGKTYYHPEKLDGNWHISGLEWGPDRIDFFLDGKKIRSYPFHPDSMIAMPMIIDLVPNAINFCNGVDPEHTVFPFEFDIDYVKVYQLNEH